MSVAESVAEIAVYKKEHGPIVCRFLNSSGVGVYSVQIAPNPMRKNVSKESLNGSSYAAKRPTGGLYCCQDGTYLHVPVCQLCCSDYATLYGIPVCIHAVVGVT